MIILILVPILVYIYCRWEIRQMEKASEEYFKQQEKLKPSTSKVKTLGMFVH